MIDFMVLPSLAAVKPYLTQPHNPRLAEEPAIRMEEREVDCCPAGSAIDLLRVREGFPVFVSDPGSVAKISFMIECSTFVYTACRSPFLCMELRSRGFLLRG